MQRIWRVSLAEALGAEKPGLMTDHTRQMSVLQSAFEAHRESSRTDIEILETFMAKPLAQEQVLLQREPLQRISLYIDRQQRRVSYEADTYVVVAGLCPLPFRFLIPK